MFCVISSIFVMCVTYFRKTGAYNRFHWMINHKGDVMATRKYFTLFGKESKDSPWEQLFGDYDRQAVQEEWVDVCDNYHSLGIIAHDDSTEAMFAELNKLNEGK